MEEQFRILFPSLTDLPNKITSESDSRYNCIAWAFGDNRRWWWPSRRAYWPTDFLGLTELEAFERWFNLDGWSTTIDDKYEPGFEKIALFVKDGYPTHAARLLREGVWTSKLGVSIDIAHSLDELEGPEYGAVFQIYQKNDS